MRTCSSVRPPSSGSGSGRSRCWVWKTPAEPGAPTTMSSRRAICDKSYGPTNTAHSCWIVWPAYLASLRCPGVHCSVPGELDHATGPAEATLDNPKGHTGPRPDSVKAGCQYCGTLEGAAEEWQHSSAAGLDH